MKILDEENCCHMCLAEVEENVKGNMIPRCLTIFVVCSKCGNKRCPHATDHRLECTGSNAVGQKGSIYE